MLTIRDLINSKLLLLFFFFLTSHIILSGVNKKKIAKLLNPQWALGATSMFYWAIGILPFKDGFYSSTNPQIGGQTVGPEKNPGTQLKLFVNTLI